MFRYLYNQLVPNIPPNISIIAQLIRTILFNYEHADKK